MKLRKFPEILQGFLTETWTNFLETCNTPQTLNGYTLETANPLLSSPTKQMLKLLYICSTFNHKDGAPCKKN